MKRIILSLGLALGFADLARADFTPIPIDPSSFNHDVVVEVGAPITINNAVNATLDGGTNKTGDSFYEMGYNTNAPTTGIPTAGSVVSKTLTSGYPGNYTFRMPPDYHVNNVILVGHNNGSRTPVLPPGALTVTGPAAFTSLSFLTCAGNGPISVAYTLMHDDGSTENGVFSSPDWFNNTNYIFNAAGRIGMGGTIDNLNGNPAGAAYPIDVTVGFPFANITNIILSFAGAGGTTNYYNTGRAAIFAVSGAKDGSTDYTNTLAVSGYDYDIVVEADGPQVPGVRVGSGTNLLNNVTATMDGGLSKANNCWFEKGYYTDVPGCGIPNAGTTFRSAAIPASYTMPASYGTNCAVLLAQNQSVSNANIILSAPASYGALSFLGACANGDTFIPCVIDFQDGSSETNVLFIPDWFNRVVPCAYLAFGRVNPNNNSLNNTPEQFVNPFAVAPGGFEFRGLGLPTVRLFDAVINVSNSGGTITNIALNFTNGPSSGRVVSIFAVSGASGAIIPPAFGVQGTATPGQPAGAVVNNRTLLKAWEGTNNIVISVTNITGSGISYQWMKAPRGGGFHDEFYSIDYNTFANVANGGRVSGANTSALVISNALVADSADYLCVASTAGGSVTSLVATVMILTTNQSLLVGVSAGDTITPIASDASPTAESIDHVIDQVAQKWLSDGLQSPTCCGGPRPFTGPVGYVVTPVSGASICTGMRFYTANDSTGRDPYDYTLEGSNDGATWTPITGGAFKGTLFLPTGRNGTGPTALDPLAQNVIDVNFANATGYKEYRVSITNNYNGFNDVLMQVAEIQLLGTLVPNPPVFTKQPQSVTVFAGTSPEFSAEATIGYPRPHYQWYTNSILVPGATNSIYTYTNAQLANSGSTVTCHAINTFGDVPSTTVTLTVIPDPTNSYPVAILADQPVGYWRLNEADNGAGNDGAVSHDYAGGHNGSYSNVVLAVAGYNSASDPDTAGQFGSLVTSNSYVAEIQDLSFVRASNAVSGGTFSVEAWVFGSDQLVDAAVVSKGYNGGLQAGTGTGTEQFVLDVAGSDPRKFRFLVRDSAGNGYVAQSSITPFNGTVLSPVPVWHHLIGVCDQPHGQLHLYIDGLLAATGSIPSNAGILDQPLPMTIGARQSGGSTGFDNQWSGIIDDVSIYASALSSTQAIGHFYAAQLPPIITLQPTNTTVANNSPVTFYSGAYGAGTLSYQWYNSDGVNPTTPVAGQTASNMTFTTTSAQNLNNFQLVVTNAYGASTGAVAQLTVVSGPPSFITDLPSSQTIYIGHIMQLSVTPGGDAPFTYSWTKNGSPITDDYRTSGSSSNVLTIFFADTGDTGNYQVTVANGSGSLPSTVDAVTVTNAQSGVPFTSAGTGWTMQGSTPPIMGNGTLELTSDLGNTARSAFMNNKLALTSFNASFVYQDAVPGAGGADGVTFCIQNDSRGATAVGAGGGGLAYSGITPSFALALNIYDPNTRGVRFCQNGPPPAGAGAYMPATPVLIGGNTDPVQINVTYLNGVVSATFHDTVSGANFQTNMVVDIASIVGGTSAYVGFTGADGGVNSTQIISNFTMVAAAPAVTLQASHAGNSLILSWPVGDAGIPYSTSDLGSGTWTKTTAPVAVVGGNIQVTVTPLSGVSQFYRLQVYP